MLFSYLDKEEFKPIWLLDPKEFLTEGEQFSIHRYNPKTTSLHRHGYIQINYVRKGSGSHLINKNTVAISSGDIFIIPPYIPHKIITNPDDPLEVIEFEFSTKFILPDSQSIEECAGYLDFAYLEPFMVAEEQVKPRFKLNKPLQAEVEALLSEVLEESREHQPGYMLVVKALLLKLLVTIGRAYTREIEGTDTERTFQQYKNMIAQAKDYIDAHYATNISLKEMSEYVGYSQSHFCYLFKAITGKTAVEYINTVRVQHAIELLTCSKLSVLDISQEAGFNTVSNFNKTFKLITGLSPRDYRKFKANDL